MELTVRQQGNKVLLNLSGRKQDLLLTPLNAEKLADRLDEVALLCELADPELIRGETWDLSVCVFDGYVVIRVKPPLGVTTQQIPLPFQAARQLSKLLRQNAIWAGYKLALISK